MEVKELWLIWRSDSRENRRRYRVGTLRRDGDKYIFNYGNDEDFVEAREAGLVSFPGFENLEKKYVSEGDLFSNIVARLPKPERDDYLDILNRYDIALDDDKFKILIATKGRQVGDNFEFVRAFDGNKVEFDVAGVNHRQLDKIEKAAKEGYLASGAKLILKREEDNRHDKFAIRIILPTGKDEVFIGYVPRYYSEYLAKKIDDGVDYSAVVARVDLGSKIRDEKISTVVRLRLAA